MAAIFRLILSIQFIINAYAVDSNDEDNQTPGYTWKRTNFEEMFGTQPTSVDETEGTEVTPQTQPLKSNQDEAYAPFQSNSIPLHTDRSGNGNDPGNGTLLNISRISRPFRKFLKTCDLPLAGSSSTNCKNHLTITLITRSLPSATRLDAITPASQ